MDFHLERDTFGLLDRVMGFKMVKEEGDKVFEIQLDMGDSCLTTVATSMGWRGEPGLEDEEAIAFLLKKTSRGCARMDFVGVVYMWEELGGAEVERQKFSQLMAEHLVEVLNDGLYSHDFPDDMEVIQAEHREEGGRQLIDLHIVHGHTVTLEVKW